MTNSLVDKWASVLVEVPETQKNIVAILCENQEKAIHNSVTIESGNIVATTRKLLTKWSLDISQAPRPLPDVWKRYKVSFGGTLVITKETSNSSPIPFHYRWEGIEREIYTIGGFHSEEAVMKHIKEYFHMVEGVELHERQDNFETENHNS